MSSLADLMEQESSKSVERVDQDGLSSVASIARNIREKEDLIAELEENLKEEKKALNKLTDEELPALLHEVGINKFELADGSTIEVKQTYGASILVANREAAYEWLRDNNYDDIIKNTVNVQFGRGEDDSASAFAALAAKEGYIPEQKTEIHPQTLRAFVKERVENGDEFPMELFGAFVGQRAVIKRGKI
jgi:hypothetical protein